jgi:hypothetical protein
MGKILTLVAALAAATALAGAQPASTRLISSLSVGNPQTYRNLTLFPLTGPVQSSAGFRLLDEAIQSGQVKVQEKDGGEVNTVRVRNTGKTYVFGMAGEIVSGAKQDRMLQDDVLLPPGSGWLDVPVYCTEHGRWTGSSSFGTKGYVASGQVRERAAKSRSQEEVWAAVDEAHEQLGVAAPSRAFARVYEDRDAQEQAKPYVERFCGLPSLSPRATGVAVAVGGSIVCVDAFASPDMFRKMWPKLLRSYVVDALASQPHGRLGVKDAQQFLCLAAGAAVTELPTVGAGRLQRLDAGNSSGTALVFRSGVVHLDLFPDATAEREDGSAPRLDVRRQRTIR